MTTKTGTATRINGYIEGEIVELYVLDCASCGVVFGINRDYERRRRDDARQFYCPNGHSNSWHTDEASRLRGELASAKSALESARSSTAYWRSESATLNRRRQAMKGQVTKLRKRIAAGVCPCCTRTFQNLATHMKNQHPEFTPEPVE